MTPSVALTPRLAVAYEERNPHASDVVVLVHGFPDDARTWDALLAYEPFASARTIVPYLRGFGATRFRDAATPRQAHASALARDVVDLLDALGIARCTLVGHDWGARAAYGAAVLAPERVATLVALSVGYGTNVPGQTMDYAQTQAYWYHWFFATARGTAALRDDRRGLCRHLWRTWSPSWNFSDEAFEATAASFDSPDFAEVVAHSYRHRWGFAAADLADPAAVSDDARLATLPQVAVPTLVVHGDEDGATLLEASAGRESFFTDRYERVVLRGAGHFVQREAPSAVARAYTSFRAGDGSTDADGERRRSGA
ncbi:MAG: alpha/beta hydrolase [Vulcanimicrobiaceae bacterium]